MLPIDHPLRKFARHVVEHPDSWEDARDYSLGHELYRDMAEFEGTFDLPILSASQTIAGPLAPDPEGFVASALLYFTMLPVVGLMDRLHAGMRDAQPWAKDFMEVLRTMQGSLPAGPMPQGQEFIRFGGLKLIEHLGLADGTLPALRRHICDDLLCVVNREEDQVLWARLRAYEGCLRLVGTESDRMVELERAIHSFENSLGAIRRQENPGLWVAAATRLAAAFRRRLKGDPKDNLETAIRWLKSAFETADLFKLPQSRAIAAMELGICYLSRNAEVGTDNLENARWHLETALEAISQEESPETWAECCEMLSILHQHGRLGAPHENAEHAIRYTALCLQVWTRRRNAVQWGRMQFRMGKLHIERLTGNPVHNLRRAIRCYEMAAAVLTREDNKDDWVAIQMSLGCAHAVLAGSDGSVEIALQCFERAAQALEPGDSDEWANVQRFRGMIYQRRTEGDPDQNVRQALSYLQDAAQRLVIVGKIDGGFRCLTQMGEIEGKRGNWATACRHCEAAAALLAEAERGCRSHAESLGLWRQGTGVFEGLAVAHVQCHRKAATGTGGKQARHEHAERALYWIERSRQRELTGFSSRDAVAGSNELALRMVEERRSQLDRFLDIAHRSRRLFTSGGEMASQTELVESLLRNASELLHAVQPGQRSQCGASERSSQIDWASVQRIQSQLLSGQQEFLEVAPLTIEQIRQTAASAGIPLLTLKPTSWGACAIIVLPDGTIDATLIESCTLAALTELLMDHDGDQVLGGWFFGYQKLQEAAGPKRVAHTADESIAGSGLSAFQTFLTAMDDTLVRLNELLWQPLQDWLQPLYPPASSYSFRANVSAPPLVLLTSQVLNDLPITAVGSHVDGARRFIMDDYRISFARSVRQFQRCLQRERLLASRPRGLLAVCDPTGHLPGHSLPGARQEVEAACRLINHSLVLGHRAQLIWERATCDRICQELPRWPVALLSTHGVANPLDAWGGSGLYTADSTGKEGEPPQLTVGVILTLDLSAVWLILLSACETAVTHPWDPVVERFGLPYAFLKSGAATVIGTLWPVESAVTAALVSRFFMELLDSQSAGTSKSEALWRAQHWLRRQTPESLRSAGFPVKHFEGTYEHPFWWAAFICEGAA